MFHFFDQRNVILSDWSRRLVSHMSCERGKRKVKSKRHRVLHEDPISVDGNFVFKIYFWLLPKLPDAAVILISNLINQGFE